MVKSNKIKIIIITCFIFSIVCCNPSRETPETLVVAPSFDPQNLNAEILKYKTWTLVNSKPEKMAPEVETYCADVSRKALVNPHKDKYIRVYVNDFGRDAMFQRVNPRFPVGSIIVKEKLPDEKSEEPEFYTIMVKRESGFDPDNGNWQYLTMDKTKSKIEEPGIDDQKVSCQYCHMEYKVRSDYVSREYLRLK